MTNLTVELEIENMEM